MQKCLSNDNSLCAMLNCQGLYTENASVNEFVGFALTTNMPCQVLMKNGVSS